MVVEAEKHKRPTGMARTVSCRIHTGSSGKDLLGELFQHIVVFPHDPFGVFHLSRELAIVRR